MLPWIHPPMYPPPGLSKIYHSSVNGQDRSELAYFNVAELNVTAGFQLNDIFWSANISLVPQTSDPGPVATTPTPVGRVLRRQSMGAEESPEKDLPFDPGAPEGVKGTGAVKEKSKGREADMEGVQEADSKCAAGAFARSIAWLDKECKLGIGLSAQDIYKDLIAKNVSAPGQGGANSRDEWVEYKNTYAREKSKNRIVTKIWEQEAGDVDATEGVAQETGSDFLTWLKKEIKKCDVEIAYYYPGNAHIVTALDVYKKGDDYFVRYRDDEAQGDDAKGDGKGGKYHPPVKTAKIYKKDGIYRFGSDGNKIYFAVSECCTPAPPPTATPTSTLTPSTLAPTGTSVPSLIGQPPTSPPQEETPTPATPTPVISPPQEESPPPVISSPTEDSPTPEICPVLACCEDDCCGLGTEYSVASGFCELSPGASGFESHSASWESECATRSCCESDCCAAGTVWDASTLFCVAL